MKDRVRELILSEGFTSSAFADEIGVQRSSLSHILTGRNNPSLDFVIKTKNRFPNLNISWLVMGEGEMYITENQISNNDQAIRNTPQTIFSAFPEASSQETVSKDKKDADSQEKEPVFSIRQVDQIVVFYSDKTFSTYTPEKSV